MAVRQRPMQLSRHVISSGVTATLLLILALLCLSGRAGACTGEEREALLSLLADLSPRPGDGLNASWHGGSPDCCTWDGVGCGADGNGDGAVTRVWLPRRGLRGTISPAVAKLSALTHLNLSGNSLGGAFPAALLSLPNAAVVDVSYNRLSGSLPDLPPAVGAGGALPLLALDVSSNNLAGQFPSTIWAHTPSLVSLNASNNSFHGAIPSFCVSTPDLAVLDLSVNKLGGGIPAGFGNCSRLRVLSVGRNNLTGELPDDIFDVKPLQQLLLPSNQIQGRLDPGRIAKLSNLVSLDLSYNALTGELPESISQLPKLEELLLAKNKLTGTLPPALSNWTGLRCLDLRWNSFVGDLDAVDFSGLRNLTILDIAANNFTGTIPQSIYSCTSLEALRVANNEMEGQVPPEIGNLRRLQFLSLTINSFTNISGMFWSLQGCQNLTALLVSYNFYGEALPDVGWVGDHVRGLQVLVMENCKLTGQIPTWLSKLQDLSILDLAGNRLTGPIPRWIGSLKKLYYLDLSRNQLSGEIPPELAELPLLTSEQARKNFNMGHMPVTFTLTPNNGPANRQVRQVREYKKISGVATTLNLSNNYLTGKIPREIGRLVTLQVLDVGSNNLSGGIPPELYNLPKLQFLILRRNHLTGPIPAVLNRLNFLAVFSVSYNDLEGPIPTGGQFDAFPPGFFRENPKLCGKVIAVPCTKPRAGGDSASSKLVSKRILVAIVLGVCSGVIVIVVLAGCMVIAVRRAKPKLSVGDSGKFAEASMFDSMTDLFGDDSKSKDEILIMSEAGDDVTFSDILKATNNFSAASIIGSGGYGLVYLAELEDGTRLAVKKLNGDMCLVEREFRAEVETLSSAAARHENLVPLQGFCVRGRLRLLLYPYMANGSLHDWLHDRPGGAEALTWRDRLRIARGASRGVLHIHEHCTPRIVHRDIKSSNILLDESGEARVADFGLARLMLPDRTHVTTELVGTPGYIPPEYGQEWVATRRGDVYSFGVVLLELLTGRRPVEVVPTQRQQWVLVGWVARMRSQGRHVEVLDRRIRGGGDEAQMLYVLDLAYLCVDAEPFNRPAIQEVVSWLDNVDTIAASTSSEDDTIIARTSQDTPALAAPPTPASCASSSAPPR